MNDHRSLSDRIQDPDERATLLRDAQAYEQHHRLPLIVGIVFGIALGLFFGWIVWPVEWSNAWPSDLATEAKADYVAAIADAYAGDPTGGGAAIASERLAAFDDEISAALADARAHFEANPSGQSTAQIANIDALAAAVGQMIDASPPEDVEVLPAEAESTEIEPIDAESGVVEPEEAESVESVDQIMPAEQESRNWFPLAVWLFVAFVLIAGGLFLLRFVLGMPSEDVAGGAESAQPAEDDMAHDAPMPAAAAGTFDDVDDMDGQPDAPFSDDDSQNVAAMAVGAGALLIDEDVPDPDGYGFAPEPEVEQTSGVSTTIIAEIVAEETSEEASSTESDPTEKVSTEAEPSADDAATASATAAAAAEEIGLAGVTTRGATAGGTTIGGAAIASFTAHFQRSLDDYEEAFTIENSSGYIGECGMGVNLKVGLVDNNPEHVAVLDVWFVEQFGQTQTSFHARSLVSQYGVSAKLPARIAESANASEMLLAPKRGERFQIAGEHLVIDCEVTDAKYDAFGQVDGVFTECQVEMTVRERLT